MRATPSQELIDLILHGREERNLEYKRSMSWDEPNTKASVTRSILGMANLPDYGFIILGVKQQDDGSFVRVGMTPDQIQSFTQDEVDDYVRNYADPFVRTDIVKATHNGMEFVVIRVWEFEEVPVICKKSGKLKSGKQRLRQGAMYIRPRGKCETVEVPSQTEMREIIELAVDKGVRRFAERMARTGILSLVTEPSDAERFDQQLGELK